MKFKAEYECTFYFTRKDRAGTEILRSRNKTIPWRFGAGNREKAREVAEKHRLELLSRRLPETQERGLPEIVTLISISRDGPYYIYYHKS